ACWPRSLSCPRWTGSSTTRRAGFHDDVVLGSHYASRRRGGDRARRRFGALLDRTHFAAQTERRVDQTHVAIGLRKIAQHPTGERVDLLGQQTHVVAAREQTVEQLASFGVAALQDVIVDQPEAAREKRAFARRQAVARILAFVAQDEFA